MENQAEPNASEFNAVEESILKTRTRKSPNFTVEQRQAMAERMKKVNEARIANSKKSAATEAKEQAAAQREARKKELEEEIERLKLEALASSTKLAKIPKKKPVPKVDDGSELKELTEKIKARPKKVQVQEPESEEESDEEDVPPPPRKQTIRKKVEKIPEPVVVPVPQIRAKFL